MAAEVLRAECREEL